MTRILIAALNNQYSFDVALSDWWYSRRDSGGFRLTDRGFEILKELLNLEFYELKLKPGDLDSKTLLALDKNIGNPYYIVNKHKKPDKIIFFGSKDASMAYLYDDIRLFAQRVSGRNQNDSV